MVATEFMDTTIRSGAPKSRSGTKAVWASVGLLGLATFMIVAVLTQAGPEAQETELAAVDHSAAHHVDAKLKTAIVKPAAADIGSHKVVKKCTKSMLAAAGSDCDKIKEWLGSGKYKKEQKKIEKKKKKGEAIIAKGQAKCKASLETGAIAKRYKRRAIGRRKVAMDLRVKKSTLIYKYRGMYNRRKELLRMYADAKDDASEADEQFRDLRKELDHYQDNLDTLGQKFRMACSKVHEAKKLVAMDDPHNRNLSHEVQLHYAQHSWRKLRLRLRHTRKYVKSLQGKIDTLKKQDEHREDLKEAYREELKQLAQTKHGLLLHVRRVCKKRERYLKKWKRLRKMYKKFRRQSRRERRTCKMLKLKGRAVIDSVQRTWPKLMAKKATLARLAYEKAVVKRN